MGVSRKRVFTQEDLRKEIMTSGKIDKALIRFQIGMSDLEGRLHPSQKKTPILKLKTIVSSCSGIN